MSKLPYRLFAASEGLHDPFYTEDIAKRDILAKDLPQDGMTGFETVSQMASISSSALYTEFLKRLDNKPHNYDQAQACAEEDFVNLARILDGKEAQRTKNDLPKDTQAMPRKNKFTMPVLSKITVEALPENITHIIAPGLGGIYNALMAKATRGIDYILGDISLYVNGDKESEIFHPEDIKTMPNKKKHLVTFDGFILYGTTLKEIERTLSKQGIKTQTGASVTNNAGMDARSEIDFFPPIRLCRSDIKQACQYGIETDKNFKFQRHTKKYRENIEQEINSNY